MILSLLLGVAGAAASQPQKIVGYYPSWGIYQGFTWKQVDYTQVTHVAWSFAMVDSSTGALIGPGDRRESDDLDSLVKAAHAHGVKVLVSLGGATGSGATYSGSATYSDYRSIVADLPTWMRHWDDTAKANWATTPDGGYVTWDDPRTAAMKARWAKENGYAGAIVWELSQDHAGGGNHPIMDSLAKVLLGDPVAVASRVPKGDGIRQAGGEVVLDLADGESGTLELVDPLGRVLRSTNGRGAALRIGLDGIRPGVVLARTDRGPRTMVLVVGVPSR
ncbi:MAG TPA: glycosyl hydrolase family 18 protein [Fibrobacteria bacterium]|nr:glycosyl hydrolase family 18 protein [Fibrobacteria bacterium]